MVTLEDPMPVITKEDTRSDSSSPLQLAVFPLTEMAPLAILHSRPAANPNSVQIANIVVIFLSSNV
jgi:hypothetical protein